MTIRASEQTRALVRTFLARFFENEITQGTDDLKASFFWLLSFVAAPGFLMPVSMMFTWMLIAQIRGPEALQIESRGDKVFYLGFAMIASGVVSALAWNSILMDRRDGLILGSLPVRPVTVVRAKVLALAGYVALMAAGMHTLSSFSFGVLLASGSSIAFALRGIVAHFTASFAASVCVFLAIAGLQGVVLAAIGPRLFARVSVVLQLCLVALVVAGLLMLPTITMSVVHTLRGLGPDQRPWILSTPPVWFLGVYEWMLGTSDPALLGLARRAALALGVAAVATASSYPLAYRRVMTSVIESSAGPAHSRKLRALAAWFTRLTGRHPAVRAVTQFYLATLGRVERQRFVMAIAIGIALMWGLPSWLSLFTAPIGEPRLDLLSLPLAMMTFLLLGLRIAAALPSDLRAAWMFDVCRPTPRQARAALERMMLVLGVLPVVALFAAFFWFLWGMRVAVTHTVVSTALGGMLIEILLMRVHGMPCARALNPDGSRWQSAWPAYLSAFLLMTWGVPRLERLLFDHPIAAAVVVLTLIAAAIIIRVRGLQLEPMLIDDADTLTAGNVLSLN